VAWVFLLSADHFNPYSVAIVTAAAGGAVYALRDGVPPGRLGAAGLAVWLLLWIPFDLRWYRGSGSHMELFLSSKGGYAICALLVTALGVLAFGVVGRQRQGLGPPERLDWLKALVLLVVYAAIAIPVGLATGFLGFEPDITPAKAALLAVGLALTVALPEELFFRGILDTGLRRVFKLPWVSLLISSAAFGLMHWNNRSDPTEQKLYFGLATAAGVFYGLAHRWTGRLFAAVLIHTLVDLFWIAFFRG
jgi:membrane protease YdiL (CAAX protease family)